MTKFARVTQIDNEEPSSVRGECESPQVAISHALKSLQRIVADHPETVSAISMVGLLEDAKAEAQWLGGWVWFTQSGFQWTPDTQSTD